MPAWVISGALVRSPRPGYRGEGREAVPAGTVTSWIDGVRSLGVASILCLLAEDQLAFYEGVPGGLLAAYRSAGFAVAHVPARDLQRPPLTDAQLDDVWRAYRSLPKPVLVHCSAGVDRTGQAVEHILQRLSDGAGSADRRQ